MDFKKVLIGALGTVENGTTFKRADVHHHLVQLGYSERTATNALTPSRKGSLVHTLINVSAIETHGPRGYRIIDNTKINQPKAAQNHRVMTYQGKTREGWKELGWASLDDYEANFKFCGHRYADGCWNLKVYADGTAPKKANYWVQYRRGILCGDDASVMKAHRPLLYAGVMEEMKEIEECYSLPLDTAFQTARVRLLGLTQPKGKPSANHSSTVRTDRRPLSGLSEPPCA